MEYRVGLGTVPGLADIKALDIVGLKTNVTIPGLLLESGQRYYVTVVGCNWVGMCINASSNGATVDFFPPHSGKVITGIKGPPVLYQWINKSVWARWNWCLADKKRLSTIVNSSQCSNESFYDIHSGIGMFSISVISSRTDQLLVPFKLAGLQQFSGRNVDLEDGVYSVVIEARDKTGIASLSFSNTFVVDSSAPLIASLQHGHYGEMMEFVNTPIITFRCFFVVEEDLSTFIAYKIGVGSYSGADDIIKFVSVSLSHSTSTLRANWTSPKSETIKNHQHYFITIMVKNSAGLFTIKSSPPLVSDFEAPQNGIVMDGWGIKDDAYQSYSSLYRAHWHGFTDYTGVEAVYLGLSSNPDAGVCDVKEEESVTINADFYVLTGLNLISGQKYYACLKLVDKAGNAELFWSNGVLIDTSPPHLGYVTDGRPGQDIDIQIESSVLRASWDNFTEEETRIVSYQLAFGSFPRGHDIQELTDVGLVNTAISSRLKIPELTNGQRYYASVIALNELGMPSSLVSSDGVIVDFTPPLFSRHACDGSNPDEDLRYTSESFLKATWTCEDPQSNLSSIEIAFGLQPGGTDVFNFMSLPVTQTSFIIDHTLQSGYRYFSTVLCTNTAGLTATSFSDGFVYDDTPPDPVYIQDGEYQGSSDTLVISFQFVDAESGIQVYRLKVWGEGSLNNSLNMYGSFNFSGNVTSNTLLLSQELVSGGTYYVNVTAVNWVGLESTEQSDGFVVDTTPPVCSQVWDGKGNYQDDLEYGPSSRRFIISWVCLDSESPLVRYRFSVKELSTSQYAIPFYAVRTRMNSSGSATISAGGRSTTRYLEGHTYISGIEVMNSVGLKSVYWTNGVFIDSSPPKITNLTIAFYPQEDSLRAWWLVNDKESGIKSILWGLGTTPDSNDIKNSTFVSSLSTNISVSSVSFQQGLICFLNVLAVNNGGLQSKTSSNPITLDRSAPSSGFVDAFYSFSPSYNQDERKALNSTVVVTWTGFTDPESGIKSFSWAMGTDTLNLKQGASDMYTAVFSGESVGGVHIRNQTLVANKTYFVCIRVTNGVGLHRTECSLGMLVIMGQLSAGVVSDGPLVSADDIDFQLDDKAICAHWNGFRDPVFGISRYDWCIADMPPDPHGSETCQWPFMVVSHLKTKASRFHNLTLSHGKKYYITVRAQNAKGDTIMSSSDGIIVDRTPPIGKSVQIEPSSGKETLFLTSPSAPVITWSMDDPESGMSDFFVDIGSFPFQNDLLDAQQIESLRRSLDLDLVNFTLYEGLSFYVTVTGVNMVGLKTTLVSQQVVVDWTPPENGKISALTGIGPLTEGFGGSGYQADNKILYAQWSGIHDYESDVIEYHLCVGTSQGKEIVLLFYKYLSYF